MTTTGTVRSDTYLLSLFENGDKPNEQDFADLIISKAHKNDTFLKSDIISNEEIDEIIKEIK